MHSLYGNKLINIAMVFSMALLFYGCKDNYKRVGEEAQQTIYPQGVAQNFVLTYTETPEKLESEDTKKRAPGDLIGVQAKFNIILSDFDVDNMVLGQKVSDEIEISVNIAGSNAN